MNAPQIIQNQNYYTAALQFHADAVRWERYLTENKHTIGMGARQEFMTQKTIAEKRRDLEKLIVSNMPHFVDTWERTYDKTSVNQCKLVVTRPDGMTIDEFDSQVEDLLTAIEVITETELKEVRYAESQSIWTVTFHAEFKIHTIRFTRNVVPIPKDRILEEQYIMKNGKVVTMKTILPELRAS